MRARQTTACFPTPSGPANSNVCGRSRGSLLPEQRLNASVADGDEAHLKRGMSVTSPYGCAREEEALRSGLYAKLKVRPVVNFVI